MSKHLKKFLSLFLIGTFLISFSIGQQNNTGSQNVGGTTDNSVVGAPSDTGVPNDPALMDNKLNYIDTSFCNNGLDKLTDNLSIVIAPGEEKEICIIQYNRDNSPISVGGEFIDGAIDSAGTRACGVGNTSDFFKKFVTFKPDSEGVIDIPAKSYIVRKAIVKLPIGTNGMKKGCFAYGASIKEREKVKGETFSIVVRKVRMIDLLVQGEGKIDSSISISKITNNMDENKKLSISLSAENKGSLDEIIDINGKISSVFGYSQTFNITGTKIMVGETKSISTKDLGFEFELPRYKGPLKIEINTNYKPYFDFDVSGIDPKILEGETITQTKSIFMFPTLPAIGLLVFILLIYLAFFRKPKVIIQQASTPPAQ